MDGARRCVGSDGLEDGNDDKREYTRDNTSPVDPARPDYARYPRSRRAALMNCTLRPGEALYMPAFTYHNVLNFGERAEDPFEDQASLSAHSNELAVRLTSRAPFVTAQHRRQRVVRVRRAIQGALRVRPPLAAGRGGSQLSRSTYVAVSSLRSGSE